MLETGFGQYQTDAEVEHRHQIGRHEGAVRVTVFRNRGRFGRFDDALALAAATGTTPDTDRARQTRMGVSLNTEQAVTNMIGVFARAGWADGQIEPHDFTDIDRTMQLGVSIDGRGWGRSDDMIGLAAVANGISKTHERYLNAGGTGVLAGDGRSPYRGVEAIGEVYYDWKPVKPPDVSLDFQLVGNPEYNRDRGPANVFAIRLHGPF